MGHRVTDSRVFRQRGAFAYLNNEDRYLSARTSPDFKFGVIGCGMMGQEHMRNTLLVGGASINGIFDPTPKSIDHALKMLARLQPKSQDSELPKTYGSLEEACADPDTDALIIATPNYTHLEVMRVATKYNKAIFLEKPIATSVADAIEVCRLAANHRNIVRVGLQYRHKAVYAEAITEVLEQQNIGQVCSVNMLEHRFPFLDKVGQWNKFDEYTGGTLVEKCCHYFDLINLFADGIPQQVFASGSQAVNFKEFSHDNRRADGLDQAHVVINFDNGVIGAFSLCMFVPGSREELIVCGDAGRLHASEQALLGENNQNRVELWAGENGISRVSTPTYPPYIANAGHHGSTFFEHAAFIEELATGEYRGPSLAEAFWSIAVGAAAQRSISERALIDLADILPVGFDAASFKS